MPLTEAEALADQSGIERARGVSVDEIPIIDVSPLLSGSAGGEMATAHQLRTAFETMGFCYITNHGVPQAAIDRAFAALPAFFDLPAEEKARIPCNTNQRGWLAPKKQTQVFGKKPNLSESFIFGLDLPDSDPDRMAGIPLHDTNKWPEGLPEFRAALEAYWREMCALGPKMMRGLALAMGMPADFFAPWYKKPDSLLRCAMYPPATGEFDGTFGAAPHTDNGTLTLLMQDDVGGLQLRTLNDEWIDAPSLPGTFIVNVGDMVVRFTNGHFRSTPHRVLSGRRTRYSMPFFFFPDYAMPIEPLPHFVSPQNPPRFEKVIWGEYVLERFGMSYDHFKKRPDNSAAT
jgi:isopenicillin N synthase-like dioxygenase